jgi:hypothetical protein
MIARYGAPCKDFIFAMMRRCERPLARFVLVVPEHGSLQMDTVHVGDVTVKVNPYAFGNNLFAVDHNPAISDDAL